MRKAITACNDYKDEWGGCCHTTHAEMAVLQKLPYAQCIRNKYWKLNGKNKKRKNIRKLTADLVVIKTTKNGKLSMSKPCYNCTHKLNNNSFVKFRYIYYSTRDGDIIKIKLKDMLKTPLTISSGHRPR